MNNEDPILVSDLVDYIYKNPKTGLLFVSDILFQAAEKANTNYDPEKESVIRDASDILKEYAEQLPYFW